MVRKTFSIVLWLAVALFGYVTLTVPAIAATGPAIITIALAVAAFFMWPRGRHKETAA